MAKLEHLGYACLVTITLLVFQNSLSCDFTFDDHSAIVENRHVHSNETDWISVFLVDYWGTPIQSESSHKSYRPFTSLTFRWNHIFSGLNPYGYHATNVAIHIAVTVICYRFFLNILNGDRWTSFLFALFFGIHPLKSEAVAGIVGRAELLSSFFFIVALFCYFDAAYGNFVVYTLLASLSKEQGFTVTGVCIALESFKFALSFRAVANQVEDEEKKESNILTTIFHPSLWRIFWLLLFTSGLIAGRFLLSGGSFPLFTKFDNPASFEVFPVRHLTYNYLLALNSKLVLHPLNLCADWTMNSIPLVHSIHDTRNVETCLFYLTFLALLIRAVLQLRISCPIPEDKLRRATYSSFLNEPIAVGLALSLIVVPFIPASNLFFPVGFVIAERVLYAPSIGYSLLLAIGFRNLKNFASQHKLVNLSLNSAMLITLAVLSVRSHTRNSDWKSDMTLFMSGLQVNPNNAKLYNNVGHVYERRQEFVKAMEYFRRAAQIDPEDLGAELNIARVMIALNRTEEAETLLWRLKPRVKRSSIRRRIAPHYLNLWTNLARVISTNESRLSEAENLYHEVISIRKDFVDAYINLGEIYIRRNQIAEAIDNYEHAVRMVQYRGAINPTLADLYFNIGVAKTLELRQLRMNGPTEKMYADSLMVDIAENFCRSIEANPNHKEALVNLAILLQKPQFPARKVRYYREIVLEGLLDYSAESERDVIEFNIAMTMLDLGGLQMRTRAVEHLEKAIKHRPDFRSALYNLALLYYDFKDFKTALKYLTDLARFYPDYAKAAGLLADIYSKTGQFELAQKAYAKVLERDPNNYEALHNMLTIYLRLDERQRSKIFNDQHLVERLLSFRRSSGRLEMDNKAAL